MPVYWLGEVVNLITKRAASRHLMFSGCRKWLQTAVRQPGNGSSDHADPLGHAGNPIYRYLLTRPGAGIVEANQEDYIRTARSKGFEQNPEFAASFITHLADRLLVTLFGLDFDFWGGGALLTEVVFWLQGVGSWTWRDALKTLTCWSSWRPWSTPPFFVVANALVDIVYAAIDPRCAFA